MKHRVLVAALAACAGLAFTGLRLPAAGDVGMSRAYADGDQVTKTHRKAKSASARAVELRRGGYYSYGDLEATGTRSHIYLDPKIDLQSPGGPFDSGFWFDSGIGPPWNNAPYPR